VPAHLERLPPASTVFTVEFVPYRMGWFHLRITIDDRCAMIDHDITMMPNSLWELESAVDDIAHSRQTGNGDTPTHWAIKFDDESLDTAQIDFRDNANGCSRLTIIDWCDTTAEPRLDVLIETQALCAEFKRACSAFRATDKAGPAWNSRFESN